MTEESEERQLGVFEDRILTVPNLISLARLACIPWFLWLLFAQEDRFGAALLWAAVGLTDWVDGWWARRFDVVSELGKLIDP
ncbi:MAG: CDP-alcohol phosphatidyltransferase family protein, partial [Ilumatobacteraceae bacterium]